MPTLPLTAKLKCHSSFYIGLRKSIRLVLEHSYTLTRKELWAVSHLAASLLAHPDTDFSFTKQNDPVGQFYFNATEWEGFKFASKVSEKKLSNNPFMLALEQMELE